MRPPAGTPIRTSCEAGWIRKLRQGDGQDDGSLTKLRQMARERCFFSSSERPKGLDGEVSAFLAPSGRAWPAFCLGAGAACLGWWVR